MPFEQNPFIYTNEIVKENPIEMLSKLLIIPQILQTKQFLRFSGTKLVMADSVIQLKGFTKCEIKLQLADKAEGEV